MTVVAAVFERDGRILIGQRRRADQHPLKWEFPGGKVESGETTEGALIRELREELGVDVTLGGEIARYGFHYPQRPPIELVFYRIAKFQGEPVNLAFEQIEWAVAKRLPDYDFLEGDVELVRLLSLERP